jgi:hypothetical protein
MKITVLGRGNVGGGLARLWQQAGHEVTALGSEGGDASGADVIVAAVGLVFAISQAGLGQFFYRIAPPGEL